MCRLLVIEFFAHSISTSDFCSTWLENDSVSALPPPALDKIWKQAYHTLPGHQIAGMRPIERVDVAVAALPVRAGAGRVVWFSHAEVRPVGACPPCLGGPAQANLWKL